MTKFFSMTERPVQTVEGWQSLIGKRNWRPGRSAERLATTWLGNNGIPAVVATVLERTTEFRGMVLDRAVVEHRCRVPGQGAGSATDLMVHAQSPFPVKASIAVEGKVDESFGEITSKWLSRGKSKGSSKNRSTRVAGMCEKLGLSESAVALVRYQLLHRTYAAVVDAETQGHEAAMLLVHSFSPREKARPGWGDFEKWAAVLSGQTDPAKPDVPRLAKCLDGIQVWLLWVSDRGGVCHPKQGC